MRIQLNLDLHSLIEFYETNARSSNPNYQSQWGAFDNRVDAAEFTSNRPHPFLIMTGDTTYTWSFETPDVKISSYQFQFEEIQFRFFGLDGPMSWGEVFNDVNGAQTDEWLTVKANNGEVSVETMKTIGDNSPNLYYSIRFNFLDPDAQQTRYCKIDPLIKTSSDYPPVE